MVDPADCLRWGGWRPLATASRDLETPNRPGLYRIRRVGRQDLDYIGQTGMAMMTLRKRLGMLRGVHSQLMPIVISARQDRRSRRAITRLVKSSRSPPIWGSPPWRKGLEALAISPWRQELEVAGSCPARHPRIIT
jgi:hypothetical protein